MKPPTEEELIKRDMLWRAHSKRVEEKDPSALKMQDILEKCYPPTVPEFHEAYRKWMDLFGALMVDIRPAKGFKSLTLAAIAFKKWNVEEAFYCKALKDIFKKGYGDEYR